MARTKSANAEQNERYRARIQRAVDATARAYSLATVHRYSPTQWRRIAAWLIDHGYSDQAVEAILMSKHMRWAGDSFDGRPMTLEKFARYYYGTADYGSHITAERAAGPFIDAMLRDELGLLTPADARIKARGGGK